MSAASNAWDLNHAFSLHLYVRFYWPGSLCCAFRVDDVNCVCMEYELPLSRTSSSVSYPYMGRGCTPTLYLLKYSVYRVSQEECARLREGVPYVKVYRYNPKHLCPKLNGYGDNGQRKVWSSCGSTHCTCQLDNLIHFRPWVWCQMTAIQLKLATELHMYFLQGYM